MSEIEVVQAIYAAMAARDYDRLFELIDPECVITQDPALPWGGRHVGHDGLATFAMALTGSITSAVEEQAMFQADDEVIQCGRTRGTVVANGTAFDIPEVHRWKIRDGKAISAHFAIDTAAMLAVL
ncbi:MAG: nuclear transport factor 2 family protein [Microbacterium sp.]